MSTRPDPGAADCRPTSTDRFPPFDTVLRKYNPDDRLLQLKRYFRTLPETDLLIGIETGGRAILWKRNWPLVAVNLDTVIETTHRSSRRIGTIATTADMESWVHTHHPTFDWLHPRVRWLATEREEQAIG